MSGKNSDPFDASFALAELQSSQAEELQDFGILSAAVRIAGIEDPIDNGKADKAVVEVTHTDGVRTANIRFDKFTQGHNYYGSQVVTRIPIATINESGDAEPLGGNSEVDAAIIGAQVKELDALADRYSTVMPDRTSVFDRSTAITIERPNI